MMVFLFMDLEKSMGSTLDWCCARAAEEGKPVGTYIAEIVKQYKDDLIAQESRDRLIGIQRRNAERLAAWRMAQNAAQKVGS